MRTRLVRLVPILFLTTIFGLPLGQALWELRAEGRIQAADLLAARSTGDLRRFEADLRRSSLVSRRLLPWYQWTLTRVFDRGNEKAIVGRDGWFYFADDLDLITGRGAFGPDGNGATALDVIVDFRDRLAERGIELLLVPLPSKGTTDPAHLSRAAARLDAFQPGDVRRFLDGLGAAGIEVVDVEAVYAGLRTSAAPDSRELYLPRDTHWRPEVMQAVAGAIAAHALRLVELDGEGALFRTRTTSVAAEGDIVGMLRLPERHGLTERMIFATEEVLPSETNGVEALSEAAQVLVLGDSFTLAFSEGRLGLGRGAGLAEHLAFRLGRPVDRIAAPGGAASGVRRTLAHLLGRLDGKRLVVWQISLRHLVGEAERWERLPLPEEGDPEAPAAQPEHLRVRAEIVAVSRVPSGFVYEFCLAIYEYRLLEVLEGVEPGPRIWVAHPAVVDFQPTPEAAFEEGTRHVLDLEPLERFHDLENTSWVDDTQAGRALWWPRSWAADD